MSTETFDPGTRVEWMIKSSSPNSATTVYHVGHVMELGDERIDTSDPRRMPQEPSLPVVDASGTIRWVPLDRLALYGTEDRLRRQRQLNEALVAANTARRALEQLVSVCSGLPPSDDRDDNSEHLAAALSHLRDVSRSLRLNGAQR